MAEFTPQSGGVPAGPGLPPSSCLGGYRIVRRARTGGFADVYECVHEASGRRAAVKVLHPTISVAPREVERFRREVEALRRVRHPHIVEVFEFGDLTTRPWFAMEWLEGRTLAEELALRGPLAPRDALPVIEQLAAALGAAHAAGVVHRDLKPENVMAVPDGDWFRLKLFDFGIARLLGHGERGSSLTTSGICLGSVDHMAPEQMLCDVIDERTDVYALGVVVFEIVTGRLPFVAETPVIVQMMHLDTPPPLASEHAAAALPWDDVIDRCLAKRPSKRPASAAEVVKLLRAGLAATASVGGPPRSLVIQIEVGGEPSAATERALALADTAATAAGWTVLATADDALVAGTDPGAAAAEVAARAEAICRDIARSAGIRPRVFIRPSGARARLCRSGGALPASPGVYLDGDLSDVTGAPATGGLVVFTGEGRGHVA